MTSPVPLETCHLCSKVCASRDMCKKNRRPRQTCALPQMAYIDKFERGRTTWCLITCWMKPPSRSCLRDPAGAGGSSQLEITFIFTLALAEWKGW
jgi:hypothetical protein